MRVAAAQMDIAWHDRSANHSKACHLAEHARKEGSDLLILPEMFSTGFSMDTSITPEPLDGATPTLLRTLAHGGEREILLIADIDPAKVSEIRSSMPFLKDRRTDLFD
jgi:predicted amidohydrolase